LAFPVYAQVSSSSPYSRYGLGELNNSASVSHIAHGSSGISNLDSVEINFSNPASYAALSNASFAAAVRGEMMRLSTQSNSEWANNASVSYLAIGFPVIKNRWGASFGLIPFSSVGYKAATTIYSEIVGDNVRYIYEGSGGVSRVYLGSGFRITKNLYAGINSSWRFGSIRYIRRDEFDQPSANLYFNSRINENNSFNDFYFNGGITGTFRLKNDLLLNAGITGALPADITTKRTTLIETYTAPLGTPIIRDTVYLHENEKGITTLPMSIGSGISLKKDNKWLISAEYTMEDWSSFKMFGKNDNLDNSYRMSAGGYFIPDHKGKFFKKIAYKAGGRYSQTYLLLDGNRINDVAFAFGFGIPVSLKKGSNFFTSLINISFEGGQRGTHDNNLIKEVYGRIHIGVSLTELWFERKKFE
jgi:hypothetical protein